MNDLEKKILRAQAKVECIIDKLTLTSKFITLDCDIEGRISAQNAFNLWNDILILAQSIMIELTPDELKEPISFHPILTEKQISRICRKETR